MSKLLKLKLMNGSHAEIEVWMTSICCDGRKFADVWLPQPDFVHGQIDFMEADCRKIY